MVEFCKCGSIVISDKCTNKNCSFKSPILGVATKTKKTKVKSTEDTPKKVSASNPRRSSKCVTYKISELEKNEDTIEEEL